MYDECSQVLAAAVAAVCVQNATLKKLLTYIKCCLSGNAIFVSKILESQELFSTLATATFQNRVMFIGGKCGDTVFFFIMNLHQSLLNVCPDADCQVKMHVIIIS